MSSIETPYSQEEQKILLDIARASIENGLRVGVALEPVTGNYPAPLQELRATFVTLKKTGELRGCIGTLSAIRPLVNDVAHNAYAAAFEDPRFPSMQSKELPDTTLSISILSEATPISFGSEQDLIAQLRPGVDGLIISDGYHRATFLPSVWESLESPEEFLNHLKHKAGLSPSYWSDTLKAQRYTSFSIDETSFGS
ncbi:MAG: AmmeMemoRadiSam system protein A [Gammaproteobacteria bacterium]|nr:AmmeMemoRadiSam system protein A [Gammaproteobacteria bacterium]